MFGGGGFAQTFLVVILYFHYTMLKCIACMISAILNTLKFLLSPNKIYFCNYGVTNWKETKFSIRYKVQHSFIN